MNADSIYGNLKDETVLRAKLKKLNGKKVHNKYLMTRYIFGLANDATPGFVRVRKEHNKVTMTSKRYDCKGCDLFPAEVDLTVDNFESAYKLLQTLGLKQNVIKKRVVKHGLYL